MRVKIDEITYSFFQEMQMAENLGLPYRVHLLDGLKFTNNEFFDQHVSLNPSSKRKSL